MDVTITVCGNPYKTISSEFVEQVLLDYPGAADSFELGFDLPFGIEAFVHREDTSSEEFIDIEAKGKKLRLLRNSAFNPSGDIGVSCAPEGNGAPIWSFNIPFNEYEDVFTDRGLVWVIPGNPGRAQLIVTKQAAQIPAMVTQILSKAQQVVEESLIQKIEAALC